MRAVVLREHGAPSVLRMEAWPIPEPGPGEVLLRVGAVGVSYHDVVERNGVFRGAGGLPKIIGNEIAGTVVALGAGVSGLAAGQRVCAKAFHSCGRCRQCRNGRETICPHRRSISGGYAEFVALPEETLVAIPDTVTFETACMLGSATAVALAAVRDAGQVRLDERVLVTGASGGVGLAAVEIAAAAGARVIGLTRSEAKRPDLLAAGAHEVVVAADGADFSAAVTKLTGGGADLVIDTVGSRVFTPAFKSLATGGRYVILGQLFREDVALNPARIFFKCATIIGITSARRDQLEDTVKLVAEGRVHPRVAVVYPLADAAAAHAMVEAGSNVGRVVLRPDM